MTVVAMARLLMLICFFFNRHSHSFLHHHARNVRWDISSQQYLSSIPWGVTTARNSVSDAEVLQCVDELRSPSSRLEALNRIVISSSQLVNTSLTAGDCKTIISACLEVKSEEILDQILKFFKVMNLLSSELLYVGLRMGIRKKQWALSYRMLLEVEANSFVVDTDVVNGLIQLLSRHGRVNEAMHVLDLAHRKQIGLDAECDISSYFMVISSAGRARNADVLVKAFKMMERDPNVAAEEEIFLVALNSCSLAEDFTSATEIFAVYERLYGVVQTRAYSLLLMSYVSSKESVLGIRTTQLDAVVTFLIKSNIDSSVTIANLIFQFFTIRDDLVRASLYLERMHSSLGHRPCTKAIWKYSELVCHRKDHVRALALHHFMCSHGFIPTTALIKLCLERLVTVTLDPALTIGGQMDSTSSSSSNSRWNSPGTRRLRGGKGSVAVDVSAMKGRVLINAFDRDLADVHIAQVLAISRRLLASIRTHQKATQVSPSANSRGNGGGGHYSYRDNYSESLSQSQAEAEIFRELLPKVLQAAHNGKIWLDSRLVVKYIEHVILEAPVEVLGLDAILTDLLQLFLDVTPAMAGVGTEMDGEVSRLNKGETPSTAREREQPFKMQKTTQPQTSRSSYDVTDSKDAKEEDRDIHSSRLNHLGRRSTEWRQYRMSGHLRLVEALLQRAGEHGPCIDAVAMLLRRMTIDEDLPLSAVQMKEMLQTAAGCDHGPLYLFAHQTSSYVRSSPSFSAGASSTTSAAVSPYPSGTSLSSWTTGYESPSTVGTITATDDDRDAIPYQSSSWRPDPSSSWPYNDNIPSTIPAASSSLSSLSSLPSIESLYPLVVQLLVIFRQLGYSHVFDEGMGRTAIRGIVKRRRKIQKLLSKMGSYGDRNDNGMVPSSSSSSSSAAASGVLSTEQTLPPMPSSLTALAALIDKSELKGFLLVSDWLQQQQQQQTLSTSLLSSSSSPSSAGAKSSSLFAVSTHKEILSFYFARGVHDQASTYYRQLEDAFEEQGLAIDPGLAEMYLSNMLQAHDPSEAISTLNKTLLQQQQQQSSNTNTTTHPASDSRSSLQQGVQLKISALLYAKVVNVLLRTNRSEDVRALIPLIQAKVADIVGAFPVPREVSILTLALKRLDDPVLSGNYARLLYPHISELGPQIRAPIYALLAKFALESGSQGQGLPGTPGLDYHDHLGMATSYALRISERKGTGAGVGVSPSYGAQSSSDINRQGDGDDDDDHLRFPTSRDARQDLFCLIAKQCVAQGQGLANGGQGPGPLRPDLVLALLDASSSPSPELLAHAIACLALAGMHLQALAYEPLFAAAMEQQPRFSPPYWGLTFLLYSAAQKGYGNTARRLLQDMSQRWRIAPSELDCNLAVSAYLRACTKISASVDTGGTPAFANGGSTVGASPSAPSSPGIAAADLSELFPLLFRMQSQSMGLHPAIRDDFDPMVHTAIPSGLKDFLGGVQMTMRALPMVPHPSATRAQTPSQQKLQQQHTPSRDSQQQYAEFSPTGPTLEESMSPTRSSASTTAGTEGTGGGESTRTNVIDAEAAGNDDGHSDLFDLSTPTTSSGTSVTMDSSARENSGDGNDNDIADGGNGSMSALSVDENADVFGRYGDEQEQKQTQRQDQRLLVATEGREEATDTVAASSSSLSMSGSEDGNINDTGDPLINFSEDEMKAFALMDALAKAILSPSPTISSFSSGPTSELLLNPGSSRSISTTTPSTSVFSPSTVASNNNSPRLSPASSSSSSSSSSTHPHHSRYHHQSRRQAKAMSRNINRSSPLPPHSSGSGIANNNDVPTSNVVSIGGPELALSSQGQGLGQLSPADQAASRRANLMHNMAKKERGEAISSQLALLHKKEKDLSNDDDDV